MWSSVVVEANRWRGGGRSATGDFECTRGEAGARVEDGYVHATYPGGGGGLDRRENPSVWHSQISRLFGLSPSVERKSLGEHYRREVESIQR